MAAKLHVAWAQPEHPDAARYTRQVAQYLRAVSAPWAGMGSDVKHIHTGMLLGEYNGGRFS